MSAIKDWCNVLFWKWEKLTNEEKITRLPSRITTIDLTDFENIDLTSVDIGTILSCNSRTQKIKLLGPDNEVTEADLLDLGEGLQSIVANSMSLALAGVLDIGNISCKKSLSLGPLGASEAVVRGQGPDNPNLSIDAGSIFLTRSVSINVYEEDSSNNGWGPGVTGVTSVSVNGSPPINELQNLTLERLNDPNINVRIRFLKEGFGSEQSWKIIKALIEEKLKLDVNDETVWSSGQGTFSTCEIGSFVNINGGGNIELSTCTNNGIINGWTELYASSTNYGTINGVTFFWDASRNYGVCNGPITVFIGAENYGVVNGTTYFLNSTNYGTVLGDAFFLDNSFNRPNDNNPVSITENIVKGSAKFYTGATNTKDARVIGDVEFLFGGANEGIASGDVKFINRSNNAGIAQTARFDLFSINDDEGIVLTDAVFEIGSENKGVVNKGATFLAGSINKGIVIQEASFDKKSKNEGSISGDASFSNQSEGAGIMYKNATFTQASILSGRVKGNASFDDTSFIGGTASIDGECSGRVCAFLENRD